MVTGSITAETTVAVSAERIWKAAFAEIMSLPKICAGFIDAVEVEGNGGPGTVTTLKLSPSVVSEINKTRKSRVVTVDDAAHEMKKEVLQGGSVSEHLKTEVVDYKVEAVGEGASVFKVKVDYERHDGAALAPEDEAKLFKGYFGLIKMVEAYLVAHPNEFA